MKYFETILDVRTGEETIRPYTQEEIDACVAEEAKQAVVSAKAQRNALLATSDWTILPDAPTDKVAWAAYRQALRDVPQQVGFPTNVVWPTPPQ